ncbi:Uncharacterised protein [BD1-7 clade bacterium]|uniref:PLD phosphodiesterase domain-containing protein n=1 Tax=BD1-7 clade bacterium TaxID=2029982 RepID=A0A5S9QTY7_9GAMM|nr:Uncharacterised protein [BD1-7 clade bacterium]
MKLVNGNGQLRVELTRCIEHYEEISIAVAWASANTDVFQTLLKNKKKIKKAVIGTHFFQTDPNVLEALYKQKSVKFITQPSGVFHPKVYLFKGHAGWEAIVGSANLTAGAINNNNEVSLLISSEDSDSSDVLKDLIQQIKTYSDMASYLTKPEIDRYRELAKIHRPSRDKIGATFGGRKADKGPLEVEFLTMSWKKFKKGSKRDPHDSLEERLEVLKICRDAFKEYGSFSKMPTELRQMVAGTPSTYDERWGWFGSMTGVGVFKKMINNNDKYLAKAVNSIPLEGEITKAHFDQFIVHYKRAFGGSRDGVATASRLLAMKRPDIFVCFNSKNEIKIKEAIGIKFGKKDYGAYWEELICRISTAVWWNTPQPVGVEDRAIWMGRTALLDAYFYDEGA